MFTSLWETKAAAASSNPDLESENAQQMVHVFSCLAKPNWTSKQRGYLVTFDD